MYFLLQTLFLFLFASGIALYFLDNHFLEVGNFLETFHIVIGFFASVFFILYSIEHLKIHKDSFNKKGKKKIAYSGVLCLFLVMIVLISGVVLFFYDSGYVEGWNPIHFYASFFILFSVFLHWIFRK